jgi:hypothetical protein
VIEQFVEEWTEEIVVAARKLTGCDLVHLLTLLRILIGRSHIAAGKQAKCPFRVVTFNLHDLLTRTDAF